MKKIFILSCLCVLTVACRLSKLSGESSDIQHDGNTVIVSENSPVNSKIKLYTVAETNYCAEFNTTGVVKAISGQMAEIASPFDGRVTRSFVKLGQRVNAGTPVFELYSSEFSEVVKDYFQTLQTKKLTESNLSRRRELIKSGLVTKKDMEETETEYEIALRDYESAEAALRMLGVDPGKITMGESLKVTSPIAGEVVQADMVIGHYIKSDAGPLAVVADLSKVWVVAQVKERNINSIQTNDKVEIRTDADLGYVIAGHISHISQLMDEETRSVQVLVTCDNADRRLRPGMFANVHFINAPKESIIIPSTALLQQEDDSYVLVRQSEETYLKRMVKAVMVNECESLVSEGLHAGDIIVSEGGIYLMAN